MGTLRGVQFFASLTLLSWYSTFNQRGIAIFEKKCLLKETCVLNLSTNLSETFLNPEKLSDDTKVIQYLS
jgi:hypothetical protein